MNLHESADLHKRVERYEAAVDELRAAHQDVKDLLLDHVLFERWQQIGADLGFSAMRQQVQGSAQGQAPRDLTALTNQIPEMSDSWAG
jgi:acyl carrier protein phosphodiesterase